MLSISPSKPTKAEQLKALTNIDKRSREYLLPQEVDLLIASSKSPRNGLRDSTLILLSYRHGLRVNEAVALTWGDIDFGSGTIHINRLKKGISGRHPLRKPELIALHKLRREVTSLCNASPYLFNSQQGMVISDRMVRKIICTAGEKA